VSQRRFIGKQASKKLTMFFSRRCAVAVPVTSANCLKNLPECTAF
jgi:hypothetical protein